MFGYLKEIDCLCSCLRFCRSKRTNADETLYSNGSRVIVVSKEEDGMYLVSRDAPDKNKNRTALCSNIQRSRIKTPGTLSVFLSALGFEPVRSNRITSITFERENVNIEISKHDARPDNASGDGGHSDALDDLYLIRVFTFAENATDGEKTLSRITEDLEKQVQLVKPNTRWFG